MGIMVLFLTYHGIMQGLYNLKDPKLWELWLYSLSFSSPMVAKQF